MAEEMRALQLLEMVVRRNFNGHVFVGLNGWKAYVAAQKRSEEDSQWRAALTITALLPPCVCIMLSCVCVCVYLVALSPIFMLNDTCALHLLGWLVLP